MDHMDNNALDVLKLTPESIKKLSYEDAAKMLEAVLVELETNELPIETVFAKYEAGHALSKHCESILTQVEQKIVKMTEAKDA